jgi:hypothetical protein
LVPRIAVIGSKAPASTIRAPAYAMEAAWGQVKVARDLAMIRAQVKPREFTAADWAASTRATGRCGQAGCGAER